MPKMLTRNQAEVQAQQEQDMAEYWRLYAEGLNNIAANLKEMINSAQREYPRKEQQINE